MKQVLSNLISNAADAVDIGGTIIVTLRCVEAGGRTTVNMLIEDDGPGVADEHKERIFEPFFTTKQDVGTGLGLWVSREIVERLGGSIELAEREDGSRGAEFSVIFAAIPENAGSGFGQACVWPDLGQFLLNPAKCPIDKPAPMRHIRNHVQLEFDSAD